MSAGIQPGEKNNRLIAIRFLHRNQRGVAYWLFRCDCGNDHEACGANVRHGGVKSCGCLVRDSNPRTSHGETRGYTRSKEYRIWQSMIQRCVNPNDHAFSYYGGRGITVCDRWRTSFVCFLEDMGRKPDDRHTLDRIDNDGNYEPGNVRWASWEVQSKNRRRWKRGPTRKRKEKTLCA